MTVLKRYSIINSWEFVHACKMKCLHYVYQIMRGLKQISLFFGSYQWVSFSKNQSAGSYFAMFLFGGLYRSEPISSSAEIQQLACQYLPQKGSSGYFYQYSHAKLIYFHLLTILNL